jgi:hypothetical protein
MRNKYLLFIALAAWAGASGCGSKDEAVVGKWVAYDVKSSGSAALVDVFKPKLSHFILELKPDRHFAMANESGVWSFDKDKVTLNLDTVNGKSVADEKAAMEKQFKGNQTMLATAEVQLNPQILSLSSDGKTLTLTMEAGALGNMTFLFKKAAG